MKHRKDGSFLYPQRMLCPSPGAKYEAEIIDTWNMTIEKVDDTFTLGEPGQYGCADSEEKTIKLPRKKYLAIRITQIQSN